MNTSLYTAINVKRDLFTTSLFVNHIYRVSKTRRMPWFTGHFSQQKQLNIGLFCRKWPIKIRQPLPLRHPVSLSLLRRAPARFHWATAPFSKIQGSFCHTAAHYITLQLSATHSATHIATHCSIGPRHLFQKYRALFVEYIAVISRVCRSLLIGLFWHFMWVSFDRSLLTFYVSLFW